MTVLQKPGRLFYKSVAFDKAQPAQLHVEKVRLTGRIGGRIGALPRFCRVSQALAHLVRKLEKHWTQPTPQALRSEHYLVSRPFGVLPATPYSSDLLPKAAAPNPSAARPRFNNSRIAAARDGMRVLYRKSSKSVSSSPVSMI